MVREANPAAATAINTITPFRNITILRLRSRCPANALQMTVVLEYYYEHRYKYSIGRESVVNCGDRFGRSSQLLKGTLVRTIRPETAFMRKLPASLLIVRLPREQNHVGARRYDFRVRIWSGLNQAIMAHRECRNRRCGRPFEQCAQHRMKPFAARCRENAELMKRAHCRDSWAACGKA